jgi:hypothetical protein
MYSEAPDEVRTILISFLRSLYRQQPTLVNSTDLTVLSLVTPSMEHYSSMLPPAYRYEFETICSMAVVEWVSMHDRRDLLEGFLYDQNTPHNLQMMNLRLRASEVNAENLREGRFPQILARTFGLGWAAYSY